MAYFHMEQERLWARKRQAEAFAAKKGF